MTLIDISLPALVSVFLLFIIPLALSLLLRLRLIHTLVIATGRMVLQLVLIGLFLKYLFQWNNVWINSVWLCIMITVAVFSVITASDLSWQKILIPTFISFVLATGLVVFYLNTCVLRLDNVFDARYLVVMGGMVLGNSMRGNIVGISTFYHGLRKGYREYLYVLSLGATRFEAMVPFLRHAIELALKPSLAAMATIGVVSLPGMMTGVILAGADPTVAIKYQIMIMLGIITSTTLSVVCTILFTARVSFTSYGTLDYTIFKQENKKKTEERKERVLS